MPSVCLKSSRRDKILTGLPKNKSTVRRLGGGANCFRKAEPESRITRLQAKEDICIIPTMGDEIPISGT